MLENPSMSTVVKNCGQSAIWAARLANRLDKPTVITLQGPLGAGKTTFARAFIRARARADGMAPPREIPSPSFSLIQIYDLPSGPIWHMDAYRLEKSEDAWEIGLEEALKHTLLLEWPEPIITVLPKLHVKVALTPTQGLAQGLERHLSFEGISFGTGRRAPRKTPPPEDAPPEDAQETL